MALIHITMSEKKKVDKVKKVKKKRKPIQYTKLILNMTIFLTTLTTLASIYINFKNGLGLDSVTASCWEGLKYIIPSYCAKSFFETKEENKNKIMERLEGLNDDQSLNNEGDVEI